MLAGFMSAQTPPSIDGLAWMSGAWAGSMGRAAIEEHWLAAKGGRMLGLGQTVANGKMISFEFLRIEQRADGVYYVAQPGGNPPVDFKLTRSSEQEVVFENPKHDHPKMISYRRDGDALLARLEGDEKGKHVVQEFKFKLSK